MSIDRTEAHMTAVLLALALATSTENIPKLLPFTPMRIANMPPDANKEMSAKEVMDFMNNVVNPIINEYARDVSQPEALRKALTSISTESNTKGGQVVCALVAASHPDNDNLMMYMYQSARRPGTFHLEVYIPTVQRMADKLPERYFDDLLALNFALQALTLDVFREIKDPVLQADTPENRQRLEAASMGRAMTGIIRPMQAQGRLKNSTLNQLSKLWTEVNENALDPRWLKAIAP